jgi:RNA polymerase sigma-70 factor, ECF subfamily
VNTDTLNEWFVSGNERQGSVSLTVSKPGLNLQQWLDEARAGSTQALGGVFAALQPGLLQIAEADQERQLRTKADAEDLVQQVFLEASRDWSQFQGQTIAELQAWLRQILRHKLSNLRRRYHSQKHDICREIPFSEMSSQPVRTPPPPGINGEESGPEQAAMIERILARLPEDYRRVIVLRIREGRSIAEIAGRMNRTPVAVRKLLSRAVAKARDDLERRSRGT